MIFLEGETSKENTKGWHISNQNREIVRLSKPTWKARRLYAMLGKPICLCLYILTVSFAQPSPRNFEPDLLP